MAIASERGKLIFRKMDRDLLRLSSDPHAEAVHSFRTTSRRLETLLQKLIPNCSRNEKKLLKMLSRTRRKAGTIRDLDVQLAALRSFKSPLEPRRKTQLTQRLLEDRAEQEKRLAKLLRKRVITELRKRLKRSFQTVKLNSSRDPLAVAKAILSAVSLAGPPNDEILHQYRVAVKRARYAAEFAPNSPKVAQFITELKRLQDALGNWHDWNTLTQTAADNLGEISQSSLVAALHNVTRVKFRNAVAALSASRTEPAKAPVASRAKKKSQKYLAPTQAA